MIDVTNNPYFSYNDIIERLMDPISRQVDVQLISFNRRFQNQEKIIISTNKDHTVDYYARGLYRYGLFEKAPRTYESGFHMWDHLLYDPSDVYKFIRTKYGKAHGLTIIQQHGDYFDTFIFATEPNNHQVNNFYLNQKELFAGFIDDFYQTMHLTLQKLANYGIRVPFNTSDFICPVVSLSSRQQDCALLMIEGHTAKEIAKALDISHRTVEEYIGVLKTKFEAKNRLHLIKKLQKHF